MKPRIYSLVILSALMVSGCITSEPKTNKDYADMPAYKLENRCDKKDARACYQAAIFHSLAKNRQKSNEYYKLACDYGDVSSCSKVQ